MSDTYTLQQEGWELSIQRDNQYDSFRLAGRNPKARIYFVSEPNRMRVDSFLMGRYTNIEFARRELESLCFHVFYLGSVEGLRIIYPVSRAPCSVGWQSIDATPCYEAIDQRELRLDEWIPFKTIADTNVEFALENKDVSELLEVIKKKQKPKQLEIIRKNRMAKERELREGELGHDPRGDIKAQLIAI